MPSTTSSSSARALPSSTRTTPSLPTRPTASATRCPRAASPLADRVATRAMASAVSQGRARAATASSATAAAWSMPRLRSMAFMHTATLLRPSRRMARARTMAVVVPSPASSPVRCAASFTVCAPRFSIASGNSMASATVTPSLVTSGAPQACSMATLRPRGPRVTATASASTSTPRAMRARAS
jgi:hypothetical protein